jgi:hypothetical protein
MSDHEEYKKMLSDLIQKQMVVLGPNIALDKARKNTRGQGGGRRHGIGHGRRPANGLKGRG